VVIELKCRETPQSYPITYHLAIEEEAEGPYVQEEWLKWRRGKFGQPYYILSFRRGKGWVISGEAPEKTDIRVPEKLDSPEMIAVNTLGQLAKNLKAKALRRFITGWYLSYLTADHTRGVPEAGPQERLSATGDNLPNVIQYLKERHPERLSEILKILTRRVPRLQDVNAELMADGRLLLQIKDAPFDKPILAKFTSDGTLKMLAYLTVLYDLAPPQLVGIEEPENHLHPRLLSELAEECRNAAARSQLMVTTHSPFFVNGLRPEEVWILYRDKDGYTRATRAADIQGINEFMEEGAQLGYLWTQGHFKVGDPLSEKPKRA
jgi:predicted ATPase